MRRLLRLVLILLAAVAVAAVANAVHPRGIAWYASRQAIYPEPTQVQRTAAIDREQVFEALQQGAVIVDARRPERYEEGHIPGAINIPADTAQQDIEVIRNWALPEDNVIVYCGGDECDESRIVFDLLRSMGYEQVRLYFGGWRDWRAHELPVEP